MIELNNLCKVFGGHIALDNVNISIKKGEIFGIIGRSGAGKSTLLRTINLLERPDSGQIIIDNEDITKLSSKKLRVARHKMAMIFQQFNLLNSRNVYDNIALPMRIQGITEDLIKQKIDELLEVVDLQDKKLSYPAHLSGGQKQRVAIARALSCSPKILLCDEATSALDPHTTDAILDLLKKINSLYDLTIVLVTHEMEAIKRICKSLCLVDNGKVIETTTLNQIFSKKESMAKKMLFSQLSPSLPYAISNKLTTKPNDKPLLRLYFQGQESTAPFISQVSRDLNLDLNILLANIDSFDEASCGVLIIEINANPELLTKFTECCAKANLTWEILGYVTDDL